MLCVGAVAERSNHRLWRCSCLRVPRSKPGFNSVKVNIKFIRYVIYFVAKPSKKCYFALQKKIKRGHRCGFKFKILHGFLGLSNIPVHDYTNRIFAPSPTSRPIK